MVSNLTAALFLLSNILLRPGSTVLRVDPRLLRYAQEHVGRILSIGFPSALQIGLTVVAVAAQAKFVSKYATEAVAGLGIAKKIDNLTLYFSIGVANGILPMLAYNFSSGNQQRRRDVLKTGCAIALGFSLFTLVLFELFAPQCTALFIDDPLTIQYGAAFLRRLMVSMPFMSLCYPMIIHFQAIGKVRQSLICSVLRKGKYMGTVEVADTSVEEMSRLMVGRDVQLVTEKQDKEPGKVILKVENMTVPSKLHKNNAVKNVSLEVREGEIVCLAGIEGNGQTEFIHALTGLEKMSSGKIILDGKDVTHASIRQRNAMGLSHIPEDRHKHGLVLDYTLENNMVLQRFREPEFQHLGFVRSKAVREYSDRLSEQYDVRSGQGSATITRSMSGGNQQKAIVAREIDREPQLLIAVQPTRGLDVGAIEYIHKQIIAQRDAGKAVLLVSLELDEVMNLSDRILVMYEGEIVGEFDPKTTDVQTLGLYMAGAKRAE